MYFKFIYKCYATIYKEEKKVIVVRGIDGTSRTVGVGVTIAQPPHFEFSLQRIDLSKEKINSYQHNTEVEML